MLNPIMITVIFHDVTISHVLTIGHCYYCTIPYTLTQLHHDIYLILYTFRSALFPPHRRFSPQESVSLGYFPASSSPHPYPLTSTAHHVENSSNPHRPIQRLSPPLGQSPRPAYSLPHIRQCRAQYPRPPHGGAAGRHPHTRVLRKTPTTRDRPTSRTPTPVSKRANSSRRAAGARSSTRAWSQSGRTVTWWRRSTVTRAGL